MDFCNWLILNWGILKIHTEISKVYPFYNHTTCCRPFHCCPTNIPLDSEFNSMPSLPMNPSHIKVYILQWSVRSLCFNLQLRSAKIELTLNILTWVTEFDVDGSLKYFPTSVQQSWKVFYVSSQKVKVQFTGLSGKGTDFE